MARGPRVCRLRRSQGVAGRQISNGAMWRWRAKQGPSSCPGDTHPTARIPRAPWRAAVTRGSGVGGTVCALSYDATISTHCSLVPPSFLIVSFLPATTHIFQGQRF